MMLKAMKRPIIIRHVFRVTDSSWSVCCDVVTPPTPPTPTDGVAALPHPASDEVGAPPLPSDVVPAPPTSTPSDVVTVSSNTFTFLVTAPRDVVTFPYDAEDISSVSRSV